MSDKPTRPWIFPKMNIMKLVDEYRPRDQFTDEERQKFISEMEAIQQSTGQRFKPLDQMDT